MKINIDSLSDEMMDIIRLEAIKRREAIYVYLRGRWALHVSPQGDIREADAPVLKTSLASLLLAQVLQDKSASRGIRTPKHVLSALGLLTQWEQAGGRVKWTSAEGDRSGS